MIEMNPFLFFFENNSIGYLLTSMALFYAKYI